MIKPIVSLAAAALLALPRALVPADGFAPRDSAVTLSFDQARLPEVVSALARQTGLSFIMAPEVGAIVGVDVAVSDVPFMTALDELARNYSFCVAQPTPEVVSLETCSSAPGERMYRFGGVTFMLPNGRGGT